MKGFKPGANIFYGSVRHANANSVYICCIIPVDML